MMNFIKNGCKKIVVIREAWENNEFLVTSPVLPVPVSISGLYISRSTTNCYMVSLDPGTGVYIIVIAIVAVSILYAVIRWWRWFR